MLLQLIIFSFVIEPLLTLSFNLQPKEMIHDITLDSYVTFFKNQNFNLSTMKLCFGTPNSQCLDLALSTTLPDILLESSHSEATNFNHQYNSSESYSYSISKHRRSMGFPLFNNKEYYLYGEEAVDFIHFPGSNYSKKQLTFVLIKSSQKTTPINIDGFIGLKLSDSLGMRHNNAFLSFLFESNLINSKTFALNYNRNGSGVVSFGDDFSQFEYCNISENESRERTEWKCKLTFLSIGNTNLTMQKDIIQFDSVKNAIIAPLNSGKFIIEYIISLNPLSCHFTLDMNCFVLICDAKTKIDLFPNIHLRMNNVELVIQWKHLFKLASINGSNVFLSSFLVDTMGNNDYWFIGIPGFIDNTIVFEVNEMKVRVISMSERFEYFQKTSIIIIGVLVFLFLGVCFSIYVKKYIVNK